MTTPTLDLAIITGLSGAGRSTAAKCLEDLGWFVVDNLPPALLSTMAELGHRSGGAVSRIAVVVDVRGRAFFSDLRAAVAALDARGMHPRMLFLEASDDALIRRFDHVRRPHPLQGDERVVDGIGRERALLAELRGEADLVLDTTDLNVHELRSKIDAAFGQPGANRLNATVVSFGYKYGLPLDADLVADCRFLPNPHWVEELRPYTGRDPQVRSYVLAQPGAQEFLDQYAALLRLVGEGYAREGKRYLTLAVGCTGGKHRSVAMAEQLGARLAADGVGVRVVHRDLGRE
ncbi:MULTISPECIES: RNase adapter RapZ [Frankia]|uniref:Putative P-loop-containing kinase n=1 Tax=Frankia torreyi TaxID=1856 RepID=A0A0D8BHK7_9ACTN|nr:MULTISPECIES: RNase adapter RapZ [Frankia]EIV90909.1 putative P-loop-containing kinase [Frankia sp. QA3]KJE23631.1 putative P-loop-containing kinase [Frankia torreyi]KQC37271.1 glmZ(sRNA)-inactivating NTPase [Frankia sp. ACN1ag]